MRDGWDGAVALLVWALAAGWHWQWMQWVRNFSQVPQLNNLSGGPCVKSETGDLFDLTVVVPACNEEAAISGTLWSLLGSTGLRVQVVAVDDRSTDATGLRMRAVREGWLAGKGPGSFTGLDHSIEVIVVEQLRQGWLGKPHALAAAAAAAGSSWLLFTDADVIFAPEALSRALRYAQNEALDHLVVMPEWTMESFGERAMHGAMHALGLWTLKLWRVADPAARDFLGVGAFNLVRREVYQRLGGFEQLRMEVLEDLRLGWMVKRAGYRQAVILGGSADGGRGMVSVRWARGAWGVVRNLEKNFFALYRYKTWLAGVAAFGLGLHIVLPVYALVFGGSAARAGAVAFYLGVGICYGVSRPVTRVSGWYVVTFAPAAGLFLLAMVRSVVLALVRGGIVWRGTRYSLGELRAHAGRFW